MKKQSGYRELAKYYDLIYSQKDYKKEVKKIAKLISKYKKSNWKELLDIACGTGNHIQFLIEKFVCTGIDMSKEMLDVARKKIKNVKLKKTNMINFKINKKFDIITCLFSAIGYVKTYENLRKTINNFALHLKTGGIVIIEPWFNKSTYKAGFPHITTYESKDLKIARLCVSKVKNNISIMDMNYLIAERNKEVKYFIDRHELGLFEIDKTLQIMKEAGLKSKFLKNGLTKDRGLYVGIKDKQ